MIIKPMTTANTIAVARDAPLRSSSRAIESAARPREKSTTSPTPATMDTHTMWMSSPHSMKGVAGGVVVATEVL